MNILDQIILLITGLVAAYLVWRFYTRYSKEKKLYDIYYMMGFLVLLVSGLLLIFLGWEILASPYVLTVATLIPLGISLGLMNQYYPGWKKAYAWFAAPEKPSGRTPNSHNPNGLHPSYAGWLCLG